MKIGIVRPRMIWLIIGRLGCLFNHPSQEGMNRVLARAKDIVDLVEAEPHKNVLIVSHGAFMKVLKTELNRRGYKGERFNTPINGRVYQLEKTIKH